MNLEYANSRTLTYEEVASQARVDADHCIEQMDTEFEVRLKTYFSHILRQGWTEDISRELLTLNEAMLGHMYKGCFTETRIGLGVNGIY